MREKRTCINKDKINTKRKIIIKTILLSTHIVSLCKSDIAGSPRLDGIDLEPARRRRRGGDNVVVVTVRGLHPSLEAFI